MHTDTIDGEVIQEDVTSVTLLPMIDKASLIP